MKICWFFFEWWFFCYYQSVFWIIRSQVVLLCLLYYLIEVFWVLLEEKNICIYTNHVFFHLLSFSLFIQKTKIEERGQLLPIFLSWLTLDIFNLYNIVHILQQSMQHENIIFLSYLFLLLIVLKFTKLLYFLLKRLLPLLLKLILTHYQVCTINTSIQLKHWWISVSKLKVYLAHVPFPCVFFELGKIFRKKIQVYITYIF